MIETSPPRDVRAQARRDGSRVLAAAALAFTLACGATASSTPPSSTTPVVPPASASELPSADAAYATVLAAVVTPDGLVRYDRLKEPALRAALEQAVRGYGAAAPPSDRATTLAALMNAYNANVLLMVANDRRSPGFTTVSAVDGFFDRRQVRALGVDSTLNDLENARIRPIGDARIHAALVCAAVSCPPLRAAPFTAASLDAELTEQTRRWVNDPTKFSASGDRLMVSRILEWYADDFTAPPDNGPVGFVRRFATPTSPVGALARRTPAPSVGYLEYDWSLNQAPGRSTTDRPERGGQS